MTSTEHTSGPYDICVSNNSSLIHIETGEDCPDGQGIQIATVNRGNHEQRLANALYLVRCENSHTELLEALKEAHNQLVTLQATRRGWSNERTNMVAAAIHKAGNAIVKAKGSI